MASAVMNLPTLGRRSERILEALRSKLEAREYAPNSRLPTEKELCAIFEASRTTVRRAIARLANDGYISVVQGSGTYVLPRPVGENPSCTLSVMFPFDRESLAHVQGLALDRDFLISVFTHTDWSPVTERKFLQRVVQERHRALLAFCTPLEPRNEALLDELEAVGARVIHVEHYTLELPRRSYVLPDYRRGGAMAANALMIAGYESFRFLQIKGDGPYSELAFRGFMEALQEQRNDIDPQQVRVVLPPAFEVDADARRQADTFMAGLPPNCGIVARSTDDLAMATIDLAARHGRQVPEDVGIIGIKHLLNYRDGGCADYIDYDWEELLRKAIQASVVPDWQGISSFVKPVLVKVGTVRVDQTKSK